jgi:BASS family bile acid:Na+ symporter
LSGTQVISDVAVPGIVWLLMLVVGLELTPADFRRVLVYPKAVAVATLGQLLLLPVIAAFLIWTLEPPPHVVAGMVLVAACPGGAISNFYAYLARANVALSVTLTAVSSLFALGTMPVLMSAGFALFLDHRALVEVPAWRMAAQLAVMLAAPIAVGMTLRRWRPSAVERHARGLRRSSLIALAALIGVILFDQRANLTGETGPMILAAALFSPIAIAAGWAVGRLAGLNRPDRLTLVLEFAARNLAIAAVVGIMVLGRVELVLFATLFFLVQVPIILASVAAFGLADRRASSATNRSSV